MFPQYIYYYRDRHAKNIFVSLYVMSLGGFRVLDVANSIYKKLLTPQYLDIQSWIGGIIENLYFFEYLLLRFTGFSLRCPTGPQ